MITIPRSVYEAERKMRFFGVDSHEKKHNIFIGISISNKKITADMALNYLKWAVRNTKEKVAVVIADELNIVNYEIFDKYSRGKAENRAKRIGDDFEELFRAQIEKMPEKDKIQIFRWDKVKENPRYQQVRQFLAEQYESDTAFKSAVLYFVKKYMRKKGKIITEDSQIGALATYIIGELPTLLEGVDLDGDHYGLCIYPTYFASGMSQFVMDMHAEELDIGVKLTKLLKEKAVLVEAWLD